MQSLLLYQDAYRDQVDEFLNEIDSIDFYPKVTRRMKL
jgi:hypothetical protein